MCICQENMVNEAWANQEASACGFKAKGLVAEKQDVPILNSGKVLGK